MSRVHEPGTRLPIVKLDKDWLVLASTAPPGPVPDTVYPVMAIEASAGWIVLAFKSIESVTLPGAGDWSRRRPQPEKHDRAMAKRPAIRIARFILSS
jgi:hypothetical protein